MADAERVFLRSISTWEAIVGGDHDVVGQGLNNLGSLYDAQGRFDEAEPLFERALGIAEDTHGPAHPAGAAVSHNLARVYQARGRLDDARPLYEKALAVREGPRPGTSRGRPDAEQPRHAVSLARSK